MPEFTLTHRSKTELDAAFAHAFVAHENRHRHQTQPDDPPVPVEEMLGQLGSVPEVVDIEIWSFTDELGMGAHAFLQLLNMDTNRHVAELNLVVEPRLRRQGLGAALLRQAARHSLQAGRSLLIARTNDRDPAGEPFLERYGFTRGLADLTNQLRLTDLPVGLLDAWAARNDAEYRLELWRDRIPEADLEEYARLFGVINDAPKDDLQMDDFHMTPQLLRQLEDMRLAGGRTSLTAVVRHRSGELVGLSELSWLALRPSIVQQGGTGVKPEHRNHRLGRWLKAANLRKLLEVNPQARFVRTGNANSNAPMLKLNTALGFKPYTANTVWQAEIKTVLQRLKE